MVTGFLDEFCTESRYIRRRTLDDFWCFLTSTLELRQPFLWFFDLVFRVVSAMPITFFLDSMANRQHQPDGTYHADS